jgi:hypothetical protein
MTESSPEPDASARTLKSSEMRDRARRIESELIKRLRTVGQAAVAEVCEVDASTVSRLCGDSKFGFKQFAQTMALFGLKAVPIEMKCYRPEEIEPYIQLAAQHMRRVRGAHDLELLEDDAE